jgi:predicted ATP-dependent endonuclease of OLD family
MPPGLNGSGKSNILDAICFVLGISNLSAVRAANLQDLVYKRGQAGVNKATVTIEFNNEDPDSSPFGYHQYKTISVTRQIVLGGRNKWLVNGHAATQQTIQNLFQSVQLNVNNPHFLIMQGRITKVLNMKPPEILAMIEEAAGTRMYEEKKRKALETIEKKDKKLEEIGKVGRISRGTHFLEANDRPPPPTRSSKKKSSPSWTTTGTRRRNSSSSRTFPNNSNTPAASSSPLNTSATKKSSPNPTRT